jgi:hypothetical protein
MIPTTSCNITLTQPNAFTAFQSPISPQLRYQRRNADLLLTSLHGRKRASMKLTIADFSVKYYQRDGPSPSLVNVNVCLSLSKS